MIAVESWPTTKEQSLSFPAIQRITTQLALSVILSAGFGLPPPWIPTSKTKSRAGGKEETGNDNPNQHSEMSTISDAIRLQSENLILVSHAPNWVYLLTGE